MRSNGVVEVVAVEHLLVEVQRLLRVGEDARVLGADVFGGGHEKPAGAAGRVADGVAGLGVGHLHHQLDDVAGRAELAVLPGRGDLGQHVLVKVALGVLVTHRDRIETVDRLLK